jgi:hypothetical protein
MLLKFIWTYDLIFYSLCVVKLLIFYYRGALAASATYIKFVIVNPVTNKITVFLSRSLRVRSNRKISKFELTLSKEQIQEITKSYDMHDFNKALVLTGKKAYHVVKTYVKPLKKK